MIYVSFFLAVLPLVALIVLILKVKAPIHYATVCTLALIMVLALWYWHQPISHVGQSILYGVIKGVWPIVVVILAAIYSYNLMLKTGAMQTLKDMLAGISDDKRIQVLLIAWCFGGFLEAVAGYGTAVAIPISILIALGFDPLKASVTSLIANTVPTAFGAVGIPVTMLAQYTGLSVLDISSMVVIQLAFLNVFLPFVIVAIAAGGIKHIRGVIIITLCCGVTNWIPQYLTARYLGAELPAFAGSLVSLVVLICLAKFRKKKRGMATKQLTSQSHSTRQLINAGIIYILTFLFIILSSPLFPFIKSFLNHYNSQYTLGLIQKNIDIDWFTSPGPLIFLACIIGGLIQGARITTLGTVFLSTCMQLRKSILAILAIVAMATIMDTSGMIDIIATTLVNLTGSAYIVIAPMIGALGTFVTGSDTNSNVLFGKLQVSAAEQLHINPVILAAANTAGATGGKMISPQSIAIAVSATKMEGQDSTIMSRTLKYCVLYIGILGVELIPLTYFIS